jgi:alpha-1,4-digalacturonate transport system permease protein
MVDSFLNINNWYLFSFFYLLIGFVLSRDVYGLMPRLMSTLGWPIEFTQKVFGTKSLPYLFLFPNILIFGLFTFLPLFMNFGFSVTDGTSINFENRDFSGLDNLARITQEVQIDTGGENVEDDKFKAAMADTFVFVILQVPIMILIALFASIVLNREIIGRGFWRAVFFYPVMLSPVVVAFLWTLILKRQGLLSQTLIDWNWISEPIQWLIDPSWTMFWSIFVYTWAHTGFYMLILLAGLQSIPRDLYEAAQMDGTSESRVFWRITLPLLMPILLVVTVLSLIKAVQAFEELYALQVGWISLVSYIVENAGIRGQKTFFGLGIAAMASLIVASILIVLSLLQFYLTRRQVKL